MTEQARLTVIVSGVLVVVALIVVTRAVGGGNDDPAQAAATPEPDRTHIIHLDQPGEVTVARFGTETVETSGVLTVSEGEAGVESLSIAISSMQTHAGPTGAISVALSEPGAAATRSGDALQAAFGVELAYPLLYEQVGESRQGDVLAPERLHTATARLDIRADNGIWQGTLTLAPDPVEGSEVTLPEGVIDIRSPVVFQAPGQSGGLHAYCVEVRPEQGAFTDEQVRAGIDLARDVWRQHGHALLAPEQMLVVNGTLDSLRLGRSQTRQPAHLVPAACQIVQLTAGHTPGTGMTADPTRRTLTIGANYLERCPDTSLGLAIAHGLGHAALRIGADQAAGSEMNLMRDCPQGTELDHDQKQRRAGHVAEVAREVTMPGFGSLENATFTELQRVLGEAGQVGPEPDPTPTPTPAATPAPQVTPAPQPATPAPPAPTPAPTPASTPTPTPTSTPEPTPTPEPTESPPETTPPNDPLP